MAIVCSLDRPSSRTISNRHEQATKIVGNDCMELLAVWFCLSIYLYCILEQK